MTHDVAIIGAGIAGASLAWQLAQAGQSVLLLEAEIQPGLHSTGRSAAMFMESYGPPQVRALTRASRPFYEHPPAGFADTALVNPRGVIYAAWDGQQAALDQLHTELRASGGRIDRIDAATALQLAPVLRRDGLLGALHEPDALDIDVNALHQGFLRAARGDAVPSCGSKPGCNRPSPAAMAGSCSWPMAARRTRACW